MTDKESQIAGRSQSDPVGAPPATSWKEKRERCHMTFGGGYSDAPSLEAFRHGMDTVFNLIEAEFPPLDQLIAMQDARRVVTCVYCGHQYDDGTPQSQDERLTAHIKVCAKHPMREQDARIDAMRTAMLECFVPYKALLLDEGSKTWIAPAIWEGIVKAVALMEESLPHPQPAGQSR